MKNPKKLKIVCYLSVKPLMEESCPVSMSWRRPYVWLYSWRIKIRLLWKLDEVDFLLISMIDHNSNGDLRAPGGGGSRVWIKEGSISSSSFSLSLLPLFSFLLFTMPKFLKGTCGGSNGQHGGRDAPTLAPPLAPRANITFIMVDFCGGRACFACFYREIKCTALRPRPT